MLFETAGNRDNPLIVMINGSFTTGNGFANFAEKYLKDDFYVVAPTYDGHHEGGTVFDSRKGQAAKILQWLKSEGFTNIAVLQGLSMGAEVAVELMHLISQDGTITVNRCLFDGGPFFAFPAGFRKLMYFKFKGFLDSGKKKGTEELMHNRMVRWMMGDDMDKYLDSMMDVFGTIPVQLITDETIRNETEACYTFDFPGFSEEEQKKFVFSWSVNEPAAKSRKKIREHYPYAVYKTPGALGHSGFMIKEPEKYARVLRRLACGKK